MWNSITNPNGYRNSDTDGYRNGDGHTDCNRNGHTDRNSNGHSYTYSYADSKADTDSETYAHTEASPDTAASSVTVSPTKFLRGTCEQNLASDDRFQRQLWIEMIGSEPVAIEEC